LLSILAAVKVPMILSWEMHKINDLLAFNLTSFFDWMQLETEFGRCGLFSKMSAIRENFTRIVAKWPAAMIVLALFLTIVWGGVLSWWVWSLLWQAL
jgi:hypothetical protein